MYRHSVMQWKQLKREAQIYAVLPIENSSAGPVTQVYDLSGGILKITFVGETVLPIKHMLAGVKGTTLFQH